MLVPQNEVVKSVEIYFHTSTTHLASESYTVTLYITENKRVKHKMPVIKDKTLILITHRLSMLRIVDRIVVMDSGKVLMDGPRDAVLERLRQNKTARSSVKPATKAQEV